MSRNRHNRSRKILGLGGAIPAIAVSTGVAIVAVLLNRVAIPPLLEQHKAAGATVEGWSKFLLDHHDLLPYVAVPGVVLGLAAIYLRPLRGLLAFLATLATLAAVGALLATLLAGMAPLYQIPADMNL